MSVKKYLWVLISFAIFSCGPTVVPTESIIPTPPPKTESVKPSLKRVEDGINKSIVENVKVEDKVKNQKDSIITQKGVIEDALAEAKNLENKLKSKQHISESEIVSLKNKIELIKKENSKLLETNGALSENVRYLMNILDLTRQESLITSNKLDSTEEELSKLRDNNKLLSDTVVKRDKDIQTMQKQVLKSEKQAASAKVYKNWVIGLALGFLGWTIIKNILMVYFPATRFRI